ncbi:Negative regulator of the PHO system [Tetrabaena socialis]|uniref:Negative regulator of the PHO system n=1 Tax=Tetrabaena socialis TaxID=47790 RepID=A0A2J7ZYG9_9CHLO|nr:Negative regulator of the PHO system [Tetrabaena socialis]|eukprot:PNH05308.1 Negative regulator of the PHO system [Tetrabaena socialis]
MVSDAQDDNAQRRHQHLANNCGPNHQLACYPHQRHNRSLTQVERITCTSYSTVSKACHQGQPVVVKIYDVAERDKLANAFAEIGVLLHLAGWPGAVGLLDYGRHEDKVMLMLESCDHSLKDWCDSQRFDVDTGPEYISECLRLWCTLAEMVAELHERFHVAHCDLKPGNVLLTGGLLRLADFSESMLFNGAPLLLDQARGTVSYQPPEMIHAHCVDARKADVWAMGCILYEIVTGEVLFKGPADCMRAVPAGGGVAARQRHQRRSKAGRSSGGEGDGRQARAEQRHAPEAAAAAVAAAAAEASEQQRRVVAELTARLVGSGGEEDTADGGIAARPRAQPPRVPRLSLGLARPPIGGGPAPRPAHPLPSSSTFPQQQHAPYGTQPAAAVPHLLPQFLLMAGGGGLTGRNLELIAEGSVCTEDAQPSSRTSDAWPAPSAGNTAPTTARSAALNTARSAAAHDTARSHGTSCAGGWPPPPPPSDGTARSVAASEWTLAATATGGGGAPSSGRSTGGSSAAAATAGATANSGRGEGGWRSEAGGAAAPAAGGAAAAGPLPPHRRLRHSFATQCADPAGPDWLSTEEADRMRIMCDEPPSFVAVSYDGGGSGCGGGGGSSRSGLWCTLAEMVAELHERFHVAHCDLKPGNVLLTGGLLRLADFSESMLFNGAPLLLDQARGTVSYQPPEMIHAHCVDARKADVWAMGCILYEIVTALATN